MDPRLIPVRTSLRVDAELFRRTLADVTPSRALERPNERTGHLAFLAVRVLDARRATLRLAGEDDVDPHASLPADPGSVGEAESFPSLVELRKRMARTEERADALFPALGSDELDAPFSARFALEEPSVLDGLAFLAAREAYRIGKMGLVREYLGLPPVVHPVGP